MENRDRIEEILSTLNHLEQQYGRVLSEQDPNIDTPGEVRARIQVLKDELEEAGVHLRWDSPKYRIVEPADRETGA